MGCLRSFYKYAAPLGLVTGQPMERFNDSSSRTPLDGERPRPLVFGRPLPGSGRATGACARAGAEPVVMLASQAGGISPFQMPQSLPPFRRDGREFLP